MDLIRIASSLSEQPDYGSSSSSLPRGLERTSIIRKTPDKQEWCVKSPDNPDWAGGCYPSKPEAEERLHQCEVMEHITESK